MNEQLLPCPHCGGEVTKGYYDGNQISCPKCHVGIRIELDGCQYALHDNSDEYAGYEVVYQAMQIWNRRAPGWIDAEERTPDIGEYILAYLVDVEIVLAEYMGEGMYLSSDGTAFDTDDVTHWMPLPESPEGV